MSKYIKNPEKPIQKYRFIIQAAIALICVWIGLEFYFFTKYLETGAAAGSAYRPAGVDAFLPISSLMSVYYFILTGEIHGAHPAGFFIFLGIVGVSLVFGKAFCSWMCPIGFLSELIGDFGEKIQKKLFKRILRLPRFIDYILRSLKYLLLGFFAYSIFFLMSAISLKYFLDSPYNLLADVKMYYFFADISRFSLTVIAVLFILSVLIRNFWCRYLCPYGALLGIASLLSPNKIKRVPETCIDCGLCAKACPSGIKVDKVKTVFSDECSTCISCVDACPVKDTLFLENKFTKKEIRKKMVAPALLIVYFLIVGIGIIGGNWKSSTAKEEYFIHFQNLNSLGHPRSTEEIKKLDIISKKGAENVPK